MNNGQLNLFARLWCRAQTRWTPKPTRQESSEDRERRLYPQRLRDAGLWLDSELGSPVENIGTALAYAEHYGIQLKKGLSYGVCRAFLPRDQWKAAPRVSYIPLGDWVDRSTPQLAICACLLNCRSLGLL